VPIRIDRLVRAVQSSMLDTGVYDHVPPVKDGRIIRTDIYPEANSREADDHTQVTVDGTQTTDPEAGR
jgi:hypothetical protein